MGAPPLHGLRMRRGRCDDSLRDWWWEEGRHAQCRQNEAAAALGLRRLHIPLAQLHAEAAEGLKQQGDLVVVLPVEGNRKQQLLAWQATVRLRSVYDVHAVLLRK